MRPGSGASEGSGLTFDATSASGSTPGSDVSLGPRLISSSTFAAGASGGGWRITRADAARASRQSLHWLRRLPCSQICEPPHSLHWLRSLPCSQMLPPPHSLHLLRTLPCSQMLAPPHSLHTCRCLPCSQMLPPPHSLHLLRSLPCSQMPPPPHSLHLLRTLPCSQMPAPALLAYPSVPPVLADPFPRALLAVIPSTAFPVRTQRTSRSLRLPRARSLAETLRHGVVSPRGALWPRPRGTRGSDERFIFLGPIET